MRRLVVGVALATTCVLPAAALQDDPSRKHRERHPGSSIAAALINVVYLPVRLVTTLVGAELSGLVGFLTAGDEHAANDTFDLFNGSQIVTPHMLEGKEEFRWTAYD